MPLLVLFVRHAMKASIQTSKNEDETGIAENMVDQEILELPALYTNILEIL